MAGSFSAPAPVTAHTVPPRFCDINPCISASRGARCLFATSPPGLRPLPLPRLRGRARERVFGETPPRAAAPSSPDPLPSLSADPLPSGTLCDCKQFLSLSLPRSGGPAVGDLAGRGGDKEAQSLSCVFGAGGPCGERRTEGPRGALVSFVRGRVFLGSTCLRLMSLLFPPGRGPRDRKCAGERAGRGRALAQMGDNLVKKILANFYFLTLLWFLKIKV